jgi:hypothetical protein
MKITKGYLKRIIKEEMRRVLREQEEGSGQKVYVVMGHDYYAEAIELLGLSLNKEGAEELQKSRSLKRLKTEFDEPLEVEIYTIDADKLRSLFNEQFRNLGLEELIKETNRKILSIRKSNPREQWDRIEELEDSMINAEKLHKATDRKPYDAEAWSKREDDRHRREEEEWDKQERERDEYLAWNDREIDKAGGKMI